MKNPFGKTIIACFIGYVVQAIVNIFVPLLFITFQTTYEIPLEKITLLITINFILQLATDTAATVLVDKLGYRTCAVSAHFFAAFGLIMLAVLPELLPDPFIGLAISVASYAIGGGLIEVVISPIVESCPNEHKETTMSLLHSFYCWGSVGVIVLSSLFFFTVGIEHWRILTTIWALLPLANGIFFLFVPMQNLIPKGEKGLSFSQLLHNQQFWMFFIIIICAGASEAAIAQWASTFAESSLGISKALGDLVGPALFATAMGLSRMLYGKFGEKLDLNLTMALSGFLCILSYLTIALVPVPQLSLLGMAICGFSVGIMWPGTYSSAAAEIKNGGNIMFALLAFGGDLGCAGGPAVVGILTECFQGNMKTGILLAIVFPVVLTITVAIFLRSRSKRKR